MSKDSLEQVINVADPDRGSGTVAISVQAPEYLWKRVKNLSTDRRVSQQSIWLEAMAEYLNNHPESEVS